VIFEGFWRVGMIPSRAGVAPTVPGESPVCVGIVPVVAGEVPADGGIARRSDRGIPARHEKMRVGI